MVMKIVLISSGVLPVPPDGYGGLEQIVYDSALILSRLGHDVSVVAPSDSKLPEGVKLIDGGPCNLNAHQWEQEAFNKYRPLMDSEEYKDAIWHDHSWRKFAYAAKAQNPKLNVCSTLHGMLPYRSAPPLPKPNFIGISKDHAGRISAGLGIPVRYVYNGINLEKYKINGAARNNRYLFLARITPFKGAHVFVDLMNQIKGEGDLVGDDTIVEDKNFVERVIMACNANPNVRYWSGVARDTAIELFQKSRAYILPCTPGWEEPFGLTVVEAQACGCPVIATASGAVPELIEEGKTGFVVKHVVDLAKAISSNKLENINAEDCRKNAERFSIENMGKGYETLYKEILETGGW